MSWTRTFLKTIILRDEKKTSAETEPLSAAMYRKMRMMRTLRTARTKRKDRRTLNSSMTCTRLTYSISKETPQSDPQSDWKTYENILSSTPRARYHIMSLLCMRLGSWENPKLRYIAHTECDWWLVSSTAGQVSPENTHKHTLERTKIETVVVDNRPGQ